MPGGQVRLRQVGGVAGMLHHCRRAIGDTRGDRTRLTGELMVQFTGQRQRRGGDRTDAFAEPRLSTRSASTQRFRESAWIVAPASELLGIVLEVSEQRLGEPLAEERVSADRLDVVGERVVAAAAVLSLRGVLDTTGRAEEHESRNDLGMAQCHVKRDASAEGVSAEIAGCVEQVGHEVGTFVEGRPDGRRRTVARQVECPEFASLCQNGTEPGRGPTGLGEAVEPDEHGPIALAFDLEE